MGKREREMKGQISEWVNHTVSPPHTNSVVPYHVLILHTLSIALSTLHDSDRVIEKISPYVTNPEFTPAAIEKASKACTAICMWALAMYKYHHVSQAVEPKKKVAGGGGLKNGRGWAGVGGGGGGIL